MAGGSRTSFTKRQKEHARLEKRREKEARKKQRADDKKNGDVTPDSNDDVSVASFGSNADAIPDPQP